MMDAMADDAIPADPPEPERLPGSADRPGEALWQIYLILHAVRHRGPLTVSDIADAARQRDPAVRVRLALMQTAGHAACVGGGDDSPAYWFLTDAGDSAAAAWGAPV